VSLRLALLFGALVAYLTSLDSAGVRVALAGDPAHDLPLLVLLVGTLLVGATLGLVLGMLRDVGRSYRDRREARRVSRARRLDEIYLDGWAAERAGRATEATRDYEEVLRREPGHAEARIRLGEMARQRGDAGGALNHDLQALRTEERIETVLAVADDYRALGRAADALDMYQRVLARDREHLAALRGLRDVATEDGRLAEALQAQERLVEVVSREDRAAEEAWLAGIQYEMGRALLVTGDDSVAASRYRDALQTRPDFLPALLALGDAHVKLGDTREALRVWERALETEPIHPSPASSRCTAPRDVLLG
jgi:tetratricopeptide (TPR) repeat protein